jgi:peptide deformylase
MIHPIVAYGDPVLKKEAKDVNLSKDELQQLIDDMFETMYSANGVGLAAPQIGKSLRLFVIDSRDMYEEDERENGLKEAFINPELLEEYGDEWDMEEGCLSIPGIKEDISRFEGIKIEYTGMDGKRVTKEFDDMTARVILHEYDHIEGVLFTDLLSPFKRRLLKGRLNNISKGKVEHNYRMKFPK